MNIDLSVKIRSLAERELGFDDRCVASDLISFVEKDPEEAAWVIAVLLSLLPDESTP